MAARDPVPSGLLTLATVFVTLATVLVTLACSIVGGPSRRGQVTAMQQARRSVVRVVIVWNVVLTLGVIALGLAWPRGGSARFTELTVERIDVVDGNGTRRLAITNRDRLPNVVIEGKEAARNNRIVHPAGIVVYDEHGNEAGGFATTDTADGAHQSMMIFDYDRSEALGIVQRHTSTGYLSALVLNDPPAPRAPADAGGIRRIFVATADRASTIELNDTRGRPRIRLSVDARDRPSIAILDDTGAAVSELPAR